jgi:hypothetical protein
MHLKLFAVAGMATLSLLTPVAASADCCGMPCCTGDKVPAQTETNVEAILLAMSERTVQDPWLAQDPQLAPASPVRQVAEVWFTQPVLVGKTILQGRYVIEHDNDRMARGEPCTHIYAYKDFAAYDLKTPVAAFHCTHLDRGRANDTIVVLVSTADPSIKRLTEFQFAGESAAHGYPTIR